MEEPSDALLSQLMKEAAEEAMRLTRRLTDQPTRWAILFGKQIQNKRGTRVIVSLSFRRYGNAELHSPACPMMKSSSPILFIMNI